jgi:hypothetical protein
MSTRPKRKPRWLPTPDTLALALHRAAKPSASDIQDLVLTLQDAHRAMREGVATTRHWAVLAGALSTAQAIERRGIVRGLAGHLNAATIALDAIYARAMQTSTWRATALRYDELDAISTLVELHIFQIRQLGRAELLAAIASAANKIHANGDTVTFSQTTHLERLAA